MAVLSNEPGAIDAAARRRARRRVFLCIALGAALVISGLLWASEKRADRELDARIAAWAEERRATFDLAAAELESMLLATAELLAHDPHIHTLFRQGRAAAAMAAETGQPLAEAYRLMLRERLIPAWGVLRRTFGMRLLNFQIGPEGRTFLRLDAPDWHDDALGDRRPMVAATLADGLPRSGFEIGPRAAALRGVAPLFKQPGVRTGPPIGAVEVGAAHQQVLEQLEGEFGGGYAVLIDARRAPAGGPRAPAHETALTRCGCVVASRIGLGLERALDAVAHDGARAATGGDARRALARGGEGPLMATAWRLRHGAAPDAAAAPVGWVVAWADASQAMAQRAADTRDALLAAGLAFALTLAATALAMRLASRRLESTIARATAALEESRAEEAAANAAKSRFLAAMSHEIRTPLNGVLGMAELLGRSPLAARQAEMVETIRRSGDFLLRTLNDILDVSKIEADRLELESAPFDLAETAREVHALHRGRAEEKGLALELTIEGEALCRVGDSHRVRQILHNLIGNAIKFTDRGAVRVRLRATGEASIRLEVADTGPGMTLAAARRIFEPFAQADAAVTRTHGGSGLGLSIVRGLVEAMGGTISVDTAPGHGVALTLDLPLPRASAPEARRRAAPAADSVVAGLRVLAADDDAVNRMVFAGLAEALGVRVDFVEDGLAAVEAYKRDPDRDALALDVMMPGMDGPEALKRIRAWERTQARAPTPAIACTAHALADQRDALLRAGFDAHLPKPLDLETLATTLAAVADAPRRAARARSDVAPGVT